MNLIIVDDEPLLLEACKEITDSFPFVDQSVTFSNSSNALEYVKQHNDVHAALLDIEMPVMNGLMLAKCIHDINPSVKVIFLTSYSEYAISAFEVDAVGYILKPIDEQVLCKTLIKVLPDSDKSNTYPTVTVHTFNGFEVYINGNNLHFPRTKSKELLALLIDKRGASVTSSEAITYLYEDAALDNKVKENYKKIAYTLKKTLKENGILHIINDRYNSLSINPEYIECDYYEFLKNNDEALRLYNGYYMPQYSWAEETNGLLYSLSTFCPPL